MRFFALIAAAIRNAFGAARRGLGSAVGFFGEAIAEATEPLTSRLPWLRDRAVDAAQTGAGYSAIAAGVTLDAVGTAADTVGATLGALLPHRPAGPKEVADAELANDNSEPAADPLAHVSPEARAALTSAALLGGAIQLAAKARSEGDAAMAEYYYQDLPPAVAQWLVGLSPRQLVLIGTLSCFHAAAHVEGRSLHAGLPPVPPAPKQATSGEEMRRMLAEIRERARTDRAEVAAMSLRGPRPAVLPTDDDEADYALPRRAAGPSPRPFH